MYALPSIIPKSIVELFTVRRNDEDNLITYYFRSLTRSHDSMSLTVSCKPRTKTPKERRTRRKISFCVGSFTHLRKKLARKPTLASQEIKSITAVPGSRILLVLLVVVTETWCLWKIQHQLLILTFKTNRQFFVYFWTP